MSYNPLSFKYTAEPEEHASSENASNSMGTVATAIINNSIVNSKEILDHQKQIEENLYKIFNFSPVPMLITNIATGDITITNKKFQQLLGYSAEELKQMKAAQFYVATKARSEILNQFYKSGFVDNYEVQFLKKGGAVLEVLLSLESIKIDDMDLCIKGVIDITDRKKIKRDLEKSLQLLTDQNKRLLNFSYIISHNLKSHTGNIKSIQHFIQKAGNETERNEFIEHLGCAVKSLDETMQNLNEVVSIQSDLNLKLQPLGLNLFVEKAMAILGDQIELKMTEIHNHIPANTTVNCNPAYLESIIFNFLSNAIKYSSPNRQSIIIIDTYIEANKTVLRFSDNGLGIDLNKYGSKLFGMYKTFHGNKDSRGIGLFISKNQVEAMNGKIEVESEVGKGSTFKIFL